MVLEFSYPSRAPNISYVKGEQTPLGLFTGQTDFANLDVVCLEKK